LRSQGYLTKVRDVHGIPQVRSFNRTITERIGALATEYLERSRPLGASRVLWEIDGGADVRDLRRRLGLDSGYLSRLLRTLESEGLVTVEADATDRRVRVARLTAAGAAERAQLDTDSDALAASLLAPLSEAQQLRLVQAMSVVERLLTAGLVEVVEVDFSSPDAQFCLRGYYDDLAERFGLDPTVTRSAEGALMLVARLRGEPIGCGALKLETGDIKRMWVAPSARGLGVGRRLLSELEALARSHSLAGVRLETNGSLNEAIALYRSSGYEEVEPFNDEPYAHHWFAKRFT
jgi:DNA-binding MarR family transcriptional regulator/ribosomal protein S18 acetylase RimI-like enzyme